MYARLKKKLQNLIRRGRGAGPLLACSLAAACGLAGMAGAGAANASEAASARYAAAPFQLDKDVIPQNAQSSAAELARNADCIVVGSFEEADRMVPTASRVPQGRLVNFVQRLKVREWIKGSAQNQITVVTTGIEPLPPPSQLEANERYPGAWAADLDYLLFLRKLEGTEDYAPLGLLQGVYPIQEGRTVSLEGKGFPQLNGLEPSGLKNFVNGLIGGR